MAALKNRSLTQSISGLLLLLIGVLIALPLVGAAEFSLRDGGRDKHSFKSYAWIFQQEDFITNAVTTIEIAVVAVLVTFILMVPTVAWLHIYGKKYIKFVEVLTVLPLIIPVVALATGAALALPAWLQST